MTPSETPLRGSSRNQLVMSLLMCCFLAYFVWFLRTHVQILQAQSRVQAEIAALSSKDIKGARALFEKSVSANRANPSVYSNISELCLAFDQGTLAVEYAQRGLDACKGATKEQQGELWSALSQGEVLAEPARPQTKAIAAARQALSLDPENPQRQNMTGYLLADNDQSLDEAERLLRKALSTLKPIGEDPASDSLRPMLEDSYGWLLYKKGDYPGAVAALLEAGRTMPAGVPGFAAKYYYYHLGAAYRRDGKLDEARRTLAISLHYDPAFPEAKAEIALLPTVVTPSPSPPTKETPSPAVGLKL